jgi:hypothetical protein
MDNLPDEIILMIVEYVGFDPSLRLVSPKFNHIINYMIIRKVKTMERILPNWNYRFRKVARRVDLETLKILAFYLKFKDWDNIVEINPNREIINFCIKFGAKDHNKIAKAAAKGGHLDILKSYTSSRTNWHVISKAAAKGGHVDVLQLAFRSGYTSLSVISNEAARYGNKNVLDLIIRNGFNNWNMIAAGAARGGYLDILTSALDNGANNWILIAKEAARGGNINILNDVLRRLSFTWHKNCSYLMLDCSCYEELFVKILCVNLPLVNLIAQAAARGGHLKILNIAINHGANNWGEIAVAATRGGHIEILKMALQRGVYNIEEIISNALEKQYIDIFNLALQY